MRSVSRSFSESGEKRLLGLLFLVFASISFFVWTPFEEQVDECGYTDPAASFVLGQGFTSGCWYTQTSHEFWAGNVPLHQLLLIVWFKLFGFSKAATHALNILYTLGGLGLMWLGMKRSGSRPIHRFEVYRKIDKTQPAHSS